jgi:hypothetical protein
MFVLRLGMTLEMVSIDAQFNSVLNGDIFKEVVGEKIWFSSQIHPIPLVYPADIRSETWAGLPNLLI